MTTGPPTGALLLPPVGVVRVETTAPIATATAKAVMTASTMIRRRPWRPVVGFAGGSSQCRGSAGAPYFSPEAGVWVAAETSGRPPSLCGRGSLIGPHTPRPCQDTPTLCERAHTRQRMTRDPQIIIGFSGITRG